MVAALPAAAASCKTLAGHRRHSSSGASSRGVRCMRVGCSGQQGSCAGAGLVALPTQLQRTPLHDPCWPPPPIYCRTRTLPCRTPTGHRRPAATGAHLKPHQPCCRADSSASSRRSDPTPVSRLRSRNSGPKGHLREATPVLHRPAIASRLRCPMGLTVLVLRQDGRTWTSDFGSCLDAAEGFGLLWRRAVHGGAHP